MVKKLIINVLLIGFLDVMLVVCYKLSIMEGYNVELLITAILILIMGIYLIARTYPLLKQIVYKTPSQEDKNVCDCDCDEYDNYEECHCFDEEDEEDEEDDYYEPTPKEKEIDLELFKEEEHDNKCFEMLKASDLFGKQITPPSDGSLFTKTTTTKKKRIKKSKKSLKRKAKKINKKRKS